MLHPASRIDNESTQASNRCNGCFALVVQFILPSPLYKNSKTVLPENVLVVLEPLILSLSSTLIPWFSPWLISNTFRPLGGSHGSRGGKAETWPKAEIGIVSLEFPPIQTIQHLPNNVCQLKYRFLHLQKFQHSSDSVRHLKFKFLHIIMTRHQHFPSPGSRNLKS